jgi:hypothetical protein
VTWGSLAKPGSLDDVARPTGHGLEARRIGECRQTVIIPRQLLREDGGVEQRHPGFGDVLFACGVGRQGEGRV